MTPWVVSQYKAGDPKLIATRNPYYWKVDEKGQQLPYIDTIEFTLVENNDAIAAKALACEIDMQFRNMDLKKFPLFKENETNCAYRVFQWPSAQGTTLAFWPNQSYAADPELAQDLPEQELPDRPLLSRSTARRSTRSPTWIRA